MWKNKDEDFGVDYFSINKKIQRLKLADRILIFGSLAIIVVIIAVTAGVIVVKINKTKQYAYINKEQENIQNQEEQMQEQNDNAENQVQEEQTKVEENKPLLPVYSEEGKARMDNIYVADTEEKIAYLTFDDGPSSKITSQILQTLANENVKATFFVLGSRVELLPDLVKQEYEAGHYIANHGYTHEYKKVYSSSNAVLDEYNATEIAIKNAIGNQDYSSHIFRFPGGSEGGKYASVKDEAKSLLAENNISYINWNALTNDAVGKPTAESLVNDLKTSASGKNRIVVLMHDTGTKQLTADTLSEVISYLRNEGYVFKNFYDIMY